ncbi:single-stranded DNA-binding protein [Terrabacter aerolatus]|uniref:Single-stranded DNA-binding protein n=1 Tax=Terrabacter aerolatus TaxID=422442 RepID=A0A512CYD1_9MICO|nr:single-stranded DNA-binding protein [Terrabacter aerolatus]GEO29197.1 single-stranded DNA-binding protein [Terrabacter aerolatus]
MNEIRITVHGNVVSEPVERQARNGSTYTTFRVATTPYRRTGDGRFVDGDTSFFDVIAFNALAANAATALRKGQPVIVEGNFSVKQYLSNDGTPRSSPQIDAAHVGHDLSWGRATFERVSRAAALGHDRTADPDVQASVRAMTEGASGPSDPRPDHVDADGVVDDDYDPASDSVTGTDDVLATGDPETDDYEVVERLSA